MATVTAMRKDKVDGGDERGALRRAVSDAQRTKAAVDRQLSTIASAREHVREATENLVAARIGVDAAQKGHAHHIAVALSSGSAPSSTGLIRAARATERDCEDECEAAKSAVTALETELADLQADMQIASKAVDRALAETLRPLAVHLLEEVHAHRARFLASQAALTVLGRLWNPWDELAKQIDRTSSYNDPEGRVASAVGKEWESALKALRTDPDAPLPDTSRS
jgi:hypothetical protein